MPNNVGVDATKNDLDDSTIEIRDTRARPDE
jgi:hypothetical protein